MLTISNPLPTGLVKKFRKGLPNDKLKDALTNDAQQALAIAIGKSMGICK